MMESIAPAVSIATLQSHLRVHAMPPSPDLAASRKVAPLLALATQLLKAGKPADAIAPLRQAALLQPSNAIIQHDLGLACLEAGRRRGCCRGIPVGGRRQPALLADAYFRLGIALEEWATPVERVALRPRHSAPPLSLTEAWFAPALWSTRWAIVRKRLVVSAARRRPEEHQLRPPGQGSGAAIGGSQSGS